MEKIHFLWGFLLISLPPILLSSKYWRGTIIGDISEWVRFANITIRLYLYHFSTIFDFAQASKRVSVFEGHVHQQSAMAAISSSVGLLHD